MTRALINDRRRFRRSRPAPKHGRPRSSSPAVGARRLLVALVLATTLAGTTYALASSLTVTSSPLAAGSALVGRPPCRIHVGYTSAWSNRARPAQFVVDSVTVTAIPDTSTRGCRGYHVQAALTGSPNSPFPYALAPTRVLSAATPASATWSGLAPLGLPVTALTDVHVAVTP